MPRDGGGYCNHGNVLLALQKQVPNVSLPYWNEFEEASTHWEGVPGVLLQRENRFSDGGGPIPNPLFSYTFQERIVIHLSPNFPDADYSKPKGYTTVRFSISGLMGSNAEIDATSEHNATMKGLGQDKTNKMLNQNVQMWLNDHAFMEQSRGSDSGWGQAEISELLEFAQLYDVLKHDFPGRLKC